METLRLGASTWTYLQTCDLKAALRRLKALGYSRFDVLTIPPHLWPYDIDLARRRALRTFLAREGLSFDSLNLPSTDQNLCSVTPQMREYSVQQFLDIIDLCEEIGVPMIVVVPGRRANFVPPPLEAAHGWLKAGLEILLPHAERAGVRLILENHHMSSIPTVKQMVTFLDAFGSDHLGIAYDVANGEFVGEDQAQAIRTAGRWLCQVHLSDASRSKWDHAPIGRSAVDFGAVARALREINFSGTSIVELISETPDADMADSLRELHRYGWH
ncbi:sugar phosphate isomerase/epimerase [Bradyrhizobium liaoningense]|uniref:sugar phosphate isomerase/epimerase family protein n=1 Tax=Bradyrhizobium liaoningense TaxID=43992 RepID=UPI001BAD535D|nr:sugar phosphate isomerase/epimerase family protein [Bradyrhizobium liaoningense]MBR0838830.1 sugar phosphate isomerase/epimerase [Bradyrhizobium liaoningense]